MRYNDEGWPSQIMMELLPKLREAGHPDVDVTKIDRHSMSLMNYLFAKGIRMPDNWAVTDSPRPIRLEWRCDDRRLTINIGSPHYFEWEVYSPADSLWQDGDPDATHTQLPRIVHWIQAGKPD